jgi:hypothetical protein
MAARLAMNPGILLSAVDGTSRTCASRARLNAGSAVWQPTIVARNKARERAYVSATPNGSGGCGESSLALQNRVRAEIGTVQAEMRQQRGMPEYFARCL